MSTLKVNQIQNLNGDVLLSSSGSDANLTLSGELRGPATLIIDPAAIGDNTGTVEIKGNLTVQGTQTTINSTTMTVDDLNITLASGAANAAAANGAGITIDGAAATLTYQSDVDAFEFNKRVNFGNNNIYIDHDAGSASPSIVLNRPTLPNTSTGTSILFDTIGVNYGAGADDGSGGTTPYTANALIHFRARPGTNLHSDVTLSNQFGFYADDDLDNATNNYGFYSNIGSGSGKWNFYANGAGNNYFAGNVGIGTTTPTAKLVVQNTSATATDINTNTIARFISNKSDGDSNIQISNGVDHSAIIGIQGGANIYFSSDGVEHVRILDNGNFGIGTDNPTNKLSVVSTTGGAGADITAAGNAYLILDSSVGDTSGNQVSFIDFKDNGVLKGNISVNENTSGQPLELNSATSNNVVLATGGGNVGISTTSPNSKLAVNGSITESTDGGTTYHNVVTEQDIGTDPNQVPLNQFLGQLAFMDEVGDIPVSSTDPQNNFDINFERVNDTTIKIRMRGSDGVVRSVQFTLS